MEPSQDVKSVVTLLNNIDDLIVVSNKRKEAKDVMDAVKIFSKSRHIQLPEEEIDDFYDLLYDSRPQTISGLLKNISHELIVADRKRQKNINKNINK